MKEWFIRLGFAAAGVIITLGTLSLKAKIEERRENKEAELVAEATPEAEEEETVTESEETVAPNYEYEAQLKLEQMMSVTPEPTEEPQEEYAPNSIEAAPVKWKKDYPMIDSDCTLDEKLAQRSSYDETMATNAFDKMVIENSTIDFSDVKITIMGDSITEGSTLSDDERAEYNWPTQLGNILGAKEVVNLGIGGSTVSCRVDNYPMCERWTDIDKDSDIIIVMGGSNDALFMNKWDYGHLEYDQRMNKETFCGDLDDMLSRMEWTYREHNDDNYSKLIYINPPSTILNDGVYNMDPGNMVHQVEFANAINEIAPAYSFEVIDLYNNNFLNSHDPDINAQFINDGIHCNKEGYRILAEHIASCIIQRIDQ